MYTIDFNKKIHVYFCGIGGISMSGLAEILLDAGFTVSGSDRTASELTDRLSKNGITVYIGQTETNVTSDIDVFVYTAAISQDHAEYKKALELNIPMLTRAELLGQLMKNYKMPVAIAGTHGKTTVTSMLSDILLTAEKDPTLSIGGILKTIDSNIRIGHSDYFVTEACEYTNSYHSFFPMASVILNVEADHLDFFKDIDDIRASFNKFACLTPKEGVVVIGGDIPHKEDVLKNVEASIITFGKDSSSMYYPSDIRVDESGISHFIINSPNYSPMEFTLRVPGMHNILNAVAAVCMADFLNIERTDSIKALGLFGGAKRRFEYKGTLNGVTIIDDYAHHPSEIEATLTSAKTLPHNKLWVAFQPHTYTRTIALFDDFAEKLSLADAVILAEIYAAREQNTTNLSSESLREKIASTGKECYFFSDFEQIKQFIKNNCEQNDMLITMGAGNIVNVGEELLSE